MWWWFVAAAAAALGALATWLPLRLSLFVDIYGQEPIAFLEYRYAGAGQRIRLLLEQNDGGLVLFLKGEDKNKRIPLLPRRRKRPRSCFARRFGRAFLRALPGAFQWQQFRLTGAIGTGDAAQSALASGAICSLWLAIAAPLVRQPVADADVRPEYAQTCFTLQMRCIAITRIAHIIRAGIRALTESLGA